MVETIGAIISLMVICGNGIIFILALIGLLAETLANRFHWEICWKISDTIDSILEFPVFKFMIECISSNRSHRYSSSSIRSKGSSWKSSGGSRGSSTGRRF